jgi:hypothetical protein
MSLIAMLIGGLRVLLRAAGVLFALGMIALAVVFCGRTVRLGGVIVMFGSFVVLIFSHLGLVGWQLPVTTKPRASRIVPVQLAIAGASIWLPVFAIDRS